MGDKRTYSVWHDSNEQWDPEDIEEPALRCQAASSLAAAERLADDSDSNRGEFIVRDDAANTFRRYELIRSWVVVHDWSTTIEELSSP